MTQDAIVAAVLVVVTGAATVFMATLVRDITEARKRHLSEEERFNRFRDEIASRWEYPAKRPE